MEKIIASLIERVFGNWITTVIGVLLGVVGAVAGVAQVIPSTLMWHGYNVDALLTSVAGIVGAVALLLAKDKGITVDLPKVGVILFAILAWMAAPGAVQAQTNDLPTNLYAVGASYNNAASPAIAGTALYARIFTSTDATTGVVSKTNTYAFTAMDILPVSKKPFTVSTNIGAGIAEKVFTFNGINVFMPTSAGVSITGSNTGWSWTGGIIADYNIKKSGKPTAYHIMPNVRFLKSSVSGGADYQLIGGVLFGWGK